MRLSVLTLFPDLIRQVMATSMTGRALERGLFNLETVQIRDFAVNQYGKVDDYCYGGGTGMLMMAQPILEAWQSVAPKPDQTSRTIYLSPRGQVFNQAKAVELSKMDHLILLCGHYEGVDERVIDEIVDEELSIGDYVMTGGELAACVVMDTLLRLVPGMLPNEEAYTLESHMDNLLEQPQYTRPPVWKSRKVPDVLLSGHEAKIKQWQKLESIRQTMMKRPDLFARHALSEDAWFELLKTAEENKELQR